MIPEEDQKLDQAAAWICSARHMVVLTGAGISTPSGIPDFRSHGIGLWEKDNPMEVASLTSFNRTPRRFYDWLRPLAQKIWASSPNPAHQALAALEEKGFLKAVITQNIDALHQRAGSKNVIEVHGSMQTISCIPCRKSHPSTGYYTSLVEENKLPVCPTCGHILKPDIVLFEEMLPWEAWSEAERHCQISDLFLVVGSSLTVTPASSLPVIALRAHSCLIINNLTPTPLDDKADLLLPYDAATALPEIARRLS